MTLIRYLLFLTIPSLTFTANVRPRPLTWSSKAFGPDGPWQAVQIQLGTPSQTVNLYPGGAWESLIIGSTVCNKSSSACLAKNAGVYNPSNSSTSVQVPISVAGSIQNASFTLTGGIQNLTGSASYVLDEMNIPAATGFTATSVPSFDMLVVSEGHSILANGSTYPVQVGNLALGAEVQNQSWIEGNKQINGTLITNYLYAGGQIPSNSYGLHIGSAQLGIPGSLYLGGYDQLRIVGPVSVQSYGQSSLPIDLLDISIGVAEGGSPFPYMSKTGFLAQGNVTIRDSLAVEIDPKEPYLYLPSSTCQAIAQELPVTFQPDFGFYLWNTADPLYEKIINSPAYLGFTFRLNNSITQNFTINVPFALLNLTLSDPLASTPTPYFPCSLPRLPEFRLGRSFLQAAFVGINWETNYEGVWFLAQAPGPNIALAPNVLSIEPTDRFVLESKNNWADSWSKTWVALPGNSSTSSNSASTSNTSRPGIPHTSFMSSSTKAGIAIAAVAGCALAAGAAGLWWRRKKGLIYQQALNHTGVGPVNLVAGEGDGKWRCTEMDSEPQHTNIELPVKGTSSYELPAHKPSPSHELP
jgi:hypothetical protein